LIQKDVLNCILPFFNVKFKNQNFTGDREMPMSVTLSDKLINEVRQHSSVYRRSIPKQIEYWVMIGKIAEENPDLPYSFIKDILLAQQEVADGELTPFEFG